MNGGALMQPMNRFFDRRRVFDNKSAFAHLAFGDFFEFFNG